MDLLDFIRFLGSFHETAKVVNSLRVQPQESRDEGRVSPLGHRALNDVRCESRGGDLGGFGIHG